MSRIHSSLFTIPPSRIPQLYSISLYGWSPIATPSIAECDEFFLKVQKALRLYNLQIALEKIQKDFPISYLGTILEQHRIRPQKLQIRRDHLKTLNDFQKSLGAINGLCPILGIPTCQLWHLFSALEGDTALDSPRTLTPLALQEVQFVEWLNDGFLTYLHASQPISFIIFHTPYSPSGVIAQEKGLIEWVFLPNSFSKKLTIYINKLAFLIQKSRHCILQLSGCEPHQIVTQLTTAQISQCLQFNENWQISLASYPGSFSNHYPSSKLIYFLQAICDSIWFQDFW